MHNNDLPGTVDHKQRAASASDAPQSTTAPETEASGVATSGLDLRGYELMERLGGGGMGDVYRAGDPALGRDLAVKVMKADLQGYAAAEQRFLREARVTGSLQHPSIVPIYNLGRLADGRLHYTMRLVRGRTLAVILREEAGRAERLAALLTIFEKVCQAVAYAHSKQVIHRDLKPANVMVGRFGEVQVMDWGLAKVMAAEEEPAAAENAATRGGTRIHTEEGETPLDLTQLGREMGTPAYMPPEQALGEWDTVDERADVFALGAILCETLTGRPPYRGRDSVEVLHKAKRGDLGEAMAQLEDCGADAALLGLCRDCLAPAREGRPRDAEQVAQRVAAYQAEVQERLRRAELERAAAVVKAREERKKRRWIGAAVVVLLAGMAGSTWQGWRAMQANNLAQARLGQIEKANDVLTSIFLDLDPRTEEKGGPSLRQQLSQRLEHAAAQLDEMAVGDPVTVAHLQTALGHSLLNLGQAKLAMELLSKAGMILEANLGPDHHDTLGARKRLGEAYLDAGRIADAVSLLEQVLKQREDQFGFDHPDTLTSRNSLAAAYLQAGRTADAIRLHEQSLQQMEAKLGLDHPDTLASRDNLAGAYAQAHRTAEAIRLFEQVFKQREAKLGPDHPDTLTSGSNLATAYLRASRIADAVSLLEQTVKQREAKLGPAHPDTLNSRSILASSYWLAGRTADAISLFEQTLKQQEVKLGTNHPQTLTSRHNLATAYRVAGRPAEAAPLLEQVLQQRESNLGLDHPDTLKSRNQLANAYQFVGRLTDAIRLHEQNLKQIETKLGADHPDALKSRNNLAEAYRVAGRTTQAIRLHERTLQQMEARLGPDHSDTLNAMVNLGLSYRDAGRLKEAIARFETALQRGRKRSDGLAAQLASLPGALAETYERMGQFAKAESIYRDRVEQTQRQFGYDDPRTAGAFAQLGANFLKHTKCKDAEPLLRQCLTIREKMQPDDWTTFNSRSVLGEALLGQKKYAEAEPLLVQGYQGMKQRQDKIPPAYRQLRLCEALERLVRLYDATEQKDKAADGRRKLDEARAAQNKSKP